VVGGAATNLQSNVRSEFFDNKKAISVFCLIASFSSTIEDADFQTFY
jgi:hypothetical protein